jgi:SAM-dependent methyltransferase
MKAQDFSPGSTRTFAKLVLRRLCFDDAKRWTGFYYLFLAGVQAVVTRRFVERNAKKANQVIDIGSRRSPYTKRLKAHVVCLDLPSESDGYLGFTGELSQAMQRLPNREVVYGSVLDLPFGNESFDMALCIEVIEHIDDDEKAVSEICRVLKKGGVALFTTPNGEVVPNENPYHCRHYTVDLFRHLLEKHFSYAEVWTECPWPKWIKAINARLRKAELTKSILHTLNYCLQRAVYLAMSRIVPWYRSGSGAVLIAKVVK